METKTQGSIMNSMNDMMNQMHSMETTGNVDQDFATMMKIHHQGAIAMAKAELEGGGDEHLKEMAEKMIKDQTREIEELTSWLSNKSSHRSKT
jgi:uncharacterized protein (DUF305 family)